LMSHFGQNWGWLATSVLFLLWQLPGRAWLGNLSESWPAILIALVQSLLVGWIMKKTYHVSASLLFRAVSSWLLFI